MSANSGKVIRRANPHTIKDKFLVGYQGWFTCAGDGEPVGPGHHGWLHWFNYPIPDGGRPNVDCWPDVSEYTPSELYPAPGLKTKDGQQCFLFSSRNAKTVQRHFHWMAQHGVDGAFLQRFLGQCDLAGGNEGIRGIRDEVGDRVKEAAENEGRVFAIMYDISGVAPDRILPVLREDYSHLIRNKRILDSLAYLREGGKPVIALWGFGFGADSGHSARLIHDAVAIIRDATPGGAYIVGGCPAHWRTSSDDADRNPQLVNLWLNEFDALSPWTIGRYRTVEDCDSFVETKMKGDVELLRKRQEETGRKVDYMPVILPGGSGYNLSEGNWGWNDTKREGGRFLWRQIFNARRIAGHDARMLYGAMWDEYDEGTAYMPIVEKKRQLPVHERYTFMALDEDGYDLPADWYMRIAGFAAEGLRSERLIQDTFPSKELQDYWSSRPKYEDAPIGCADAGGSGAKQGYEDWVSGQSAGGKDEPPPPPYSLEDDAAAAGPSRSSVPAASTSTNVQTQPVQEPSAESMAVSSLTQDIERVRITESPAPAPTGGYQSLPAAPPVHPLHPNSRSNSHSPSPDQRLSSANAGGTGYAPTPPPLHPSRPGNVSRPSASGAFGSGTETETGTGTGYAPTPPPVHPASSAAARPGLTSRPSTGSGGVGSSQQQQYQPPVQEHTHSAEQWPPQEWNLPQASGADTNHYNENVSYPVYRPHSTHAQQDLYGGRDSAGRPSSAQAHSSYAGPSGPSFPQVSSYNDQKYYDPYRQPADHRDEYHYPNPHNASYPSAYGSGNEHSSPNMPEFPGHPSSTSSVSMFPSASTPAPSGDSSSTYDRPMQHHQLYPDHNYPQYPSHHHSPSPTHTMFNAPPPPQSFYSPTPPIPTHQSYNNLHGSSLSLSPSFTNSTPSVPTHQAYNNLHGPVASPSPPNTPGYAPQYNVPVPGQPSSGPSYLASHSPAPNMATQHGQGFPEPGPADGPGFINPSLCQQPTPSESQHQSWGGPSLPPRPPTHPAHGTPPPHPSSYNPYGSSTPGPSGGAGGMYNSAMSAFDKFGGQKARVNLESQVGNLMQSGNKLFGKFAK